METEKADAKWRVRHEGRRKSTDHDQKRGAFNVAGTKAEERNCGQVLNDLDCHAKELVTPLGGTKNHQILCAREGHGKTLV